MSNSEKEAEIETDADASDNSVTIKLTKAITAHGEKVSSLTLRQPTGREIRKYGYPYTIRSDETIDIKHQTILNYIAELAAIPPSSVDKLAAPDIGALTQAIIPFFSQATSEV